MGHLGALNAFTLSLSLWWWWQWFARAHFGLYLALDDLIFVVRVWNVYLVYGLHYYYYFFFFFFHHQYRRPLHSSLSGIFQSSVSSFFPPSIHCYSFCSIIICLRLFLIGWKKFEMFRNAILYEWIMTLFLCRVYIRFGLVCFQFVVFFLSCSSIPFCAISFGLH